MWPLVRGLTTHDRDELLGMARRRSYRRDEVIFHEGDAADSVHFIEQGHVASRAFTEDGETVTYQLLGPGEVFGLLSLQSGRARRYGTTVALDPTVTHVIDAGELRSRCLGDPAMGQVLIDLLAAQIRSFAAALVEALFVPVDTRVLDSRVLFGTRCENDSRQRRHEDPKQRDHPEHSLASAQWQRGA